MRHGSAELQLEFRSPTRTEFLSLEPTTDREGEAVSLKLRVEAQVHGFSARCESWLERQAVVDFATALKALEATRSGEAVLQGEDPEDLELKLSSLDRVGHMLLEFTVSRLTVVGDRGQPVTNQLTGGFEVDPGLVPGLVVGFQQLGLLFTARR